MSDETKHPAWCSPEHCHLSEGTRVHEGAPTCWEDPEVELRVESRLVGPEDDANVYVQLDLQDLRLRWHSFMAVITMASAAWLRDELTAHLDAGRQRQCGRVGRVDRDV